MEAITREEKLMDGQNVDPITRKEKILAGEDLKTITREEYFLKKYRGGGGGDVTVEELTVTENGIYQEQGKAYSPVNVELPLSSKTITENGTYTASDDNLAGFNEVTVAVEGYAKKSISNTPTAIATFNASALPMPSLTVGIEAVQDLHGYDNPWPAGGGKNKCPVNSGEVKAGNLVTFSTPLPSGTYSISFKCTRTGSSSDFASMVVYDSNDTAYITKAVTPNTGIRQNYENLNCDNGISRIYFYSIAGSWGSSQNYTLGITEFQVEQGTTATSYAPYSNICPISGWSAVNVMRCENNFYSATLADYSSTQVVGVGLATFYPIKVPYGTYTISTNAPTGYIWAGYNINDSSTLPRVYEGNPNTVTTDIIWVGLLTSDMSSAYAYNIMINQGSTPSSYVPYNGTTYTTALKDGQDNPMTCYGGTLDVVSGVLTVDRVYVDLGTLTWQGSTQITHRFRVELPTSVNIKNFHVLNSATENVPENFICSQYEVVGGRDGYDGRYDFAISGSYWNGYNQIQVNDIRYTSASDFKTAMNGVQLVYELATPIEVQLTPTAVKSQEGTNNLWADSGDVQSGEYLEAL